MIVLVSIFIILNIILAKRDSKKILLNIKIDHLYNALLYLGFCTVALIPFYYNHVKEGIEVFVALLLTRKIVFDVALNLFRKKQWNYLSTTTTSKIDRFENWVFDYMGTFKYIFYTGLLVALIIYYYKS